jgi:hypothetical protein
MLQIAAMAEEIATGGDAYPVGVREISSRLVHDMQAQAKSIEVLLSRTGA